MATKPEPESVRTDDPDLVAETKISRIMKPLDDTTRAEVVAWFARKYGPKPSAALKQLMAAGPSLPPEGD